MRIERPVLMPFDRRAITGRLHVEFAAVEANIGPKDLRKNVGDARIACQLSEVGKVLVRGLDAAHARGGGSMRIFEIIDIRVRVQIGGAGDQFVHRGPQAG